MTHVGSSPLARGLLHRRRRLRLAHGIIPARAGFTRRGARRPGLRPDHPRSRGVYPPLPVGTPRVGGSSPLARGLQYRKSPAGPRRRIIPARAGFTWSCAWAPRASGDHPRSRGVYVHGNEAQYRGPGSSPLARGLRNCPEWMTCWMRIIPARAGFTSGWIIFLSRVWDHPRSRGVYGLRRRHGARRLGSSPLARGLRMMRSVVLTAVGIIPARAGFTVGRVSAVPGAWDHPRSRGVYDNEPLEGIHLDGSSPLARGLPRVVLGVEEPEGIIPARAGFTSTRPGGVTLLTDHPRSRGVYL